MTSLPSQGESALARRLAELDDEIDRLRRKIWRVGTGLDPVSDRAGELAELQRRFQALSEEFVKSYQAWQRESKE